jgi:DNA-3-methyladenine glycosylase
LRRVSSKLQRSFYERDAIEVAPDLIGKILVHHWRGKELRARIVETEAYVGEHDLACHASKGRTKRTEVMFGPAGHAYVYFIYGMYDMLNIVCAKEGNAQAVLIRAAEAIGFNADLSGPGKLCRRMHITIRMNGMDLLGDRLFLVQGTPPREIKRTRRVGVDYAKHWRDEPLRFLDTESPAVSQKRHS